MATNSKPAVAAESLFTADAPDRRDGSSHVGRLGFRRHTNKASRSRSPREIAGPERSSWKRCEMAQTSVALPVFLPSVPLHDGAFARAAAGSLLAPGRRQPPTVALCVSVPILARLILAGAAVPLPRNAVASVAWWPDGPGCPCIRPTRLSH